MSDDHLRRLMVERFGLRIQAHMARYVRGHLQKSCDGEVVVMGVDARTGVAVRKVIALHALAQATGGIESSVSST